MIKTLMMWDGNVHTVFSLDDFLWLVDEYMGMDARKWLEETIAELEDEYGKEEYEELESLFEGMKIHHKEVMKRLRKLSEKEAGLISAKEIDRKALSNVAGEIGVITWREINAV